MDGFESVVSKGIEKVSHSRKWSVYYRAQVKISISEVNLSMCGLIPLGNYLPSEFSEVSGFSFLKIEVPEVHKHSSRPPPPFKRFIYLKGSIIERKVRKRSSSCWFALQMTVMARVGPS